MQHVDGVGGLPPRSPGGCVRPGCPHPAVEGKYLCRDHEDEQVFLRAESAKREFVAFRKAGIEKSRATIPESFAGLTLDDVRLPHLLSPETWKRNPRHAAARAARLIEEARSHRLFVLRGPLFSGGSALACAKLGSVLGAYETAEPHSSAAALGNQACYLSAGAVVRARAAHHNVDPPEVDAVAYAGFLVLDGLGTEARAEKIADLLDERLRAEKPTAIITNLTPDEAKHRYADVGEALFTLPVLDLSPMLASVPSEYAWARFDAPELFERVGLDDKATHQRIHPEQHIDAARAAVEEILTGGRNTVVLAGIAGAGKTSLAVAMGTELVERDPSRTFLFIDAYEFQRAAEPKQFGGALVENPLLANARDVGVLIIDEAGVEKIPRDKQSIVAETIHHRHKGSLVTILTTPKSAPFLKSVYGDGIFRRIADKARTRTIKIGETQAK